MYSSTLDVNGHEILDQTPISVGIPFERPVPLHIRIRNQLLQLMQEQSAEDETFQDAEDFDCPDEIDPSPYEMEDDYDHLWDSLYGGAGGTPPDKAASPEAETASQETQQTSGDKV